MVQIIERRHSFGEQFGRALGTGTGEGLKQGLQSREKAKQLAGENEQAMRLEEFKQNLIGNRENKKETEARNERLNMEELKHGHAKELQEEKYKFEDKNKVSDYQKLRVKGRADVANQAEQSLIENKGVIKDIERIRELSKDLAGPTGYLKTPFSASGAELAALGTSVLKNVIKLFNPVGAIPVAKLNFIKEQHGISKWDTQAQIEGKTKALERYSLAAIDRNEKWLAIMDKYDGNPPPEVMQEFHKQGEVLADTLEDSLKKAESNNPEDITLDKQQELSGKFVDVIGPDGQTYEIDEGELNQLPEGFRKI